MGKKLLEIVRDKIRFKHYSYRTEQVYLGWAKRYILLHNKKHPKDMGKLEIEQFLTHPDFLIFTKIPLFQKQQSFNKGVYGISKLQKCVSHSLKSATILI